AAGVLLRAAPAGAVGLQAERPARHHAGLPGEGGRHAVPAGAAAHVGLLLRPRDPPRGAGEAERRAQPPAAVRHEGRGVRAVLPAGDGRARMTSVPVVVTDVPRPPLDRVDALARYGIATVHEALGREGLLGPALRPIQQGT